MNKGVHVEMSRSYVCVCTFSKIYENLQNTYIYEKYSLIVGCVELLNKPVSRLRTLYAVYYILVLYSMRHEFFVRTKTSLREEQDASKRVLVSEMHLKGY